MLHRAVGGRDVTIAAAPGGVDVEPLDDETRPVVMKLLGAPFDLDGFYGGADGPIRTLTERLRGFRPPLQPNPFEALVTSITAQQVSLFAAVDGRVLCLTTGSAKRTFFSIGPAAAAATA